MLIILALIYVYFTSKFIDTYKESNGWIFIDICLPIFILVFAGREGLFWLLLGLDFALYNILYKSIKK